jgi:hypothetical protein
LILSRVQLSATAADHSSPHVRTRSRDGGYLGDRSELPQRPQALSGAAARHRWRACHGGPIALTAAEIRRVFDGLVIAPLRTRLAIPLRAISDIQYWSNGAASTKATPVVATTSTDSPPNSAHNEITLPY